MAVLGGGGPTAGLGGGTGLDVGGAGFSSLDDSA